MEKEHAGGRRRIGLRPQAGYLAAMVLFAAVFASVVLSGFHAPRPHELPVGIVAPASVTKQVEAGLDKAVPGGFDVQVYPSEAAARTGLAHGTVDGALIDTTGHPQLLLAQAGGTGPASTLTSAFDNFAAHSGQNLTVTDAIPPRPNDSLALSPFFVSLAVLLPSLAAGSASALLFRRSRTAWAVAAPVLASIGMAAAAGGIVDGLAGLGHYPAVAGTLALLAVAVSVSTAVLSRIKPPLAALALLAFVVLGLPDSGGPSGLASFDPAWMRHVHPALPLGLAADTIRRIVYFGGYGTANALWVLGVWAVGGVVALTLVVKWRQAKARRAGTAAVQAAAAPAVADNGFALAAGDRALTLPSSSVGVVVGFDNSAPARRALGEAARLAAATHEVLHVVYADHVLVDSDLSGFAHAEIQAARDEEAATVARAAAEIADGAGVAYTFERSQSSPTDAILHAAGNLADEGRTSPVIVVGRAGHGAAGHLLGSVPTRLLAHSSFPVLAIP